MPPRAVWRNRSNSAQSRIGLAAAAATLLSGCAHEPQVPATFADRTLAGESFQHRVFSRGHPGRGTLHVYVEGDGRAWLDSTTISSDPTPPKPLMLELMALDPQPSVYVGRPCYFGLADSPGCTDRQWTSDRYSSAVVASLERVIVTLVAEGDYDHVVLFGHSGGGTLATLLAARLAQIDALVTIAPNLDVSGWSALHGYSPLTGSLDPARTNEFPHGILQIHWLGSDDDEVPPRLIEALEPRLGDAQIRIR